MTLLVCIAGLGHDAVSEIENSAARFSGEEGNDPIARPIKGDRGYRHGMSDGYLFDLGKRIRALPARADVSIVLAYANHPGRGTREFLEPFFPFAVTMPIEPFHSFEVPKHERRKSLNDFLAKLQDDLKSLRSCASQMKDKLSGRNFSTLTLPVRNFRSDVLRSNLEALFGKLWQASDPAAMIEAAAQAIELVHPRKRIKYEERNHSSDPNKPYFLDDLGRRFKSPGNDLHGLMAEVGEGHNIACLIASRVRIGGPILSGLHYDCDYFPYRPVTDTFSNCHDEPTTAKRTSHANIAPSDAVW